VGNERFQNFLDGCVELSVLMVSTVFLRRGVAGPVADAAGQGANSIPVELRFKFLSLDAGQYQQ
jgi:hypothetical protein